MKSGAKKSASQAEIRILSNASVGQYNPTAWISEGDHLYESAKALRAVWTLKRKQLKAKRHTHSDVPSRIKRLAKIEGLPKASVLLLGYAVEMFLKSALAKAYVGCSEAMFDRDVKRRAGHNFLEIADEIAFASTARDRKDLLILRDMVLIGARYPVKNDARAGGHVVEENARRKQVADSKEFRRMCKLAIRIKAHAKRIDRDSSNPASMKFLKIDSDGAVAFRVGGHLPPRITYRLSSEQQQSGLTSLADLRKLFNDPRLIEISQVWNRALILEDTPTKTHLHK